MKTIGICADHAGFELKNFVIKWWTENNMPFKDFGTYSPESVDYPDFAHQLAEAIETGEVYPGIAICGSGNGIQMTLNKHQQIRAALCWREDIAELARQHNDANVLVMPGRFITNSEAEKVLKKFFSTSFEGGRHERRVAKIPIK